MIYRIQLNEKESLKGEVPECLTLELCKSVYDMPLN